MKAKSYLTVLLRYRWLGHLLFWLVYYLYDGPIASSIESNPSNRIIGAAIALPVKVLATYFTLYLITHIYPSTQRQRYFLPYLLGSVLCFGLLQRAVSYQLTYPLFYPDARSVPLLYWPKVVMEIFGIYSIVAMATTFHLVKQWYLNQRENQLLKSEKLEAELKFLKSQIQPHFLFNTLNNLYTLTLMESKKAPEIVHKLSQLMSYMLYDSNQANVPLAKEIEYIENYITLEKIRYGDRLDVALNVYELLEGIRIAPLLILPFVENSFKHGFSNQIDRVWVHIDILVKENTLVIKVENSRSSANTVGTSDRQEGIGLQNVRRRLELIYKNHYSLQLFSEEDSFLAVLKLDLKAQYMRETTWV